MAVFMDGVRYTWTSPVCQLCWDRTHPDREAVRIVPDHTEQRQCVICGYVSMSGIFERIDPRTVRYPAIDE
jgi:hypothetical protein